MDHCYFSLQISQQEITKICALLFFLDSTATTLELFLPNLYSIQKVQFSE